LGLVVTHVPTSWRGVAQSQSVLVVRSGTAAEVSVETVSVSVVQSAAAFSVERRLVRNLVRVSLTAVTHVLAMVVSTTAFMPMEEEEGRHGPALTLLATMKANTPVRI